MTGAGFPDTCERFLECIAGELAKCSGISVSRARELAKEALWIYLVRHLAREWEARYGEPSRGLPVRLRKAARRIPGLRKAWRAARGFTGGRKQEISLAALRRRASPYHADFAPIYQAVTGHG